MSKFLSEKYAALTPYTPGEQPQNRKYVKLNTNESPFPPSEKAVKAAQEQAEILQLYSDPECKVLVRAIAEHFSVGEENVICTNGSDEILDFAFKCFCDDDTPAAFPEISYGFYPVYAQANRVPYTEIPLKADFSIDAEDYCGINKTIIIANPNAPTGIALPLSDIEKIVATNPDNVVLIDEAYVDFGAESAVSLTKKYKNLLVAQTFSKSRSLAGGRLGFGIASAEIISDLNTLRFSTNPYNINRMTMFAGAAAILDDEYMLKNSRVIQENREYTTEKLNEMGFSVLPSKANFIFAETDKIDGGRLYLELKERGVLVRHFTKPSISNFNRITIGTREQMDILLDTIKIILGEK